MATDRDLRIARLTQHRRDAADAKEKAALDAVTDMLAKSQPVSFTDVQRAARVSSWFVYNNPTVRAAITKARETQARIPSRPTPRQADDGLRTELLAARAEIADLRKERDRLKGRLRRDLGATVEQHSQADLVARIQDLDRLCVTLTAELHEARSELAQRREEVTLLAEELEGARAAIRRMMREKPRA